MSKNPVTRARARTNAFSDRRSNTLMFGVRSAPTGCDRTVAFPKLRLAMNVRPNGVPDWCLKIGVTRRSYGSLIVALILPCHVEKRLRPSIVLTSAVGVKELPPARLVSRLQVSAKLASSDQRPPSRRVAVLSHVE